MKLFILVCMLIFTSVNLYAQEADRCDSSCVKEVKTILKENVYSKGYVSTWIEKANRRRGDSLVIALRKIYKEDQLILPQNIELFLPIIHNAFAGSSEIKNEEDKIPTETLRYLDDIYERNKDSILGQKINETSTFIKQKTNNQEK